jgi:hypothetical protein
MERRATETSKRPRNDSDEVIIIDDDDDNDAHVIYVDRDDDVVDLTGDGDSDGVGDAEVDTDDDVNKYGVLPPPKTDGDSSSQIVGVSASDAHSPVVEVHTPVVEVHTPVAVAVPVAVAGAVPVPVAITHTQDAVEMPAVKKRLASVPVAGPLSSRSSVAVRKPVSVKQAPAVRGLEEDDVDDMDEDETKEDRGVAAASGSRTVAAAREKRFDDMNPWALWQGDEISSRNPYADIDGLAKRDMEMSEIAKTYLGNDLLRNIDYMCHQCWRRPPPGNLIHCDFCDNAVLCAECAHLPRTAYATNSLEISDRKVLETVPVACRYCTAHHKEPTNAHLPQAPTQEKARLQFSNAHLTVIGVQAANATKGRPSEKDVEVPESAAAILAAAYITIDDVKSMAKTMTERESNVEEGTTNGPIAREVIFLRYYMMQGIKSEYATLWQEVKANAIAGAWQAEDVTSVSQRLPSLMNSALADKVLRELDVIYKEWDRHDAGVRATVRAKLLQVDWQREGKQKRLKDIGAVLEREDQNKTVVTLLKRGLTQDDIEALLLDILVDAEKVTWWATYNEAAALLERNINLPEKTLKLLRELNERKAVPLPAGGPASVKRHKGKHGADLNAEEQSEDDEEELMEEFGGMEPERRKRLLDLAKHVGQLKNLVKDFKLTEDGVHTWLQNNSMIRELDEYMILEPVSDAEEEDDPSDADADRPLRARKADTVPYTQQEMLKNTLDNEFALLASKTAKLLQDGSPLFDFCTNDEDLRVLEHISTLKKGESDFHLDSVRRILVDVREQAKDDVLQKAKTVFDGQKVIPTTYEEAITKTAELGPKASVAKEASDEIKTLRLLVNTITETLQVISRIVVKHKELVRL